MDCYRLEEAIGAAVAGGSRLAVIVFKPVIQGLGLVRSIDPVINGPVAGRHDVQTGEFLVVIPVKCFKVIGPSVEVPGPVRMRRIERGRPLCADVRAVLRGERGAASAGMPCCRYGTTVWIEVLVAAAFPGNGIDVAAVAHRDHRGAVRQDGLCGGVLEREVGGVQLAGTGAVGAGGLGRHGDRRTGLRLLGHGGQVGIAVVIRVLDHIDDLVIALGRGPLGVEGGVFLQREGRGRRLGASGVRKPAVEGIARAGGICGEGDLGAVGRRHRLYIISAGNVIGQGEVSARIVDVGYHVFAGQFNVLIAVVIVGIGVVLGLRRDGRIRHAFFGFRFDKGGVVAAVQILQVMIHRIGEVSIDIFVVNGKLIDILFRVQRPGRAVEPVRCDGDGRDRGVVQRLAGDLIRHRRLGRRYRIAALQIAADEFINTSADFHLIGAVHIIITNGELIGGDGREDSHGVEGILNRVADINRFAIGLILPVIEDLPFYKGIVRHGGDLVAGSQVNKVLGFGGDDVALIVLDQEGHADLFRKERVKRQILADGGGRRVLGALAVGLRKPAHKGAAGLDRIGGQDDGGSFCGGKLLVRIALRFECNGEDVLLVVGFHREIAVNDGADGELVGRALIDPLADLVGLRGHFGQFVDGKASIDVSRPGLLGAVLLNEGNGVDDLLPANNGREGLIHNGVSRHFRAFPIDPLGDIAGHCGDSGKLTADGLALFDLDRQGRERLSGIRGGIEGDRNGCGTSGLLFFGLFTLALIVDSVGVYSVGIGIVTVDSIDIDSSISVSFSIDRGHGFAGNGRLASLVDNGGVLVVHHCLQLIALADELADVDFGLILFLFLGLGGLLDYRSFFVLGDGLKVGVEDHAALVGRTQKSAGADDLLRAVHLDGPAHEAVALSGRGGSALGPGAFLYLLGAAGDLAALVGNIFICIYCLLLLVLRLFNRRLFVIILGDVGLLAVAIGDIGLLAVAIGDVGLLAVVIGDVGLLAVAIGDIGLLTVAIGDIGLLTVALSGIGLLTAAIRDAGLSAVIVCGAIALRRRSGLLADLFLTGGQGALRTCGKHVHREETDHHGDNNQHGKQSLVRVLLHHISSLALRPVSRPIFENPTLAGVIHFVHPGAVSCPAAKIYDNIYHIAGKKRVAYYLRAGRSRWFFRVRCKSP